MALRLFSQKIEPVLGCLLDHLVLALKSSDDQLEDLLRQLVAMIALHCADVDFKQNMFSLAINASLKCTAARLVYESLFAKIGRMPMAVFRQLFLLKPAWLAALVAGWFQLQMSFCGWKRCRYPRF